MKYFVYYEYWATGEGATTEYDLVDADSPDEAREVFRRSHNVHPFYDAGMTVYEFDKDRAKITEVVANVQRWQNQFLLDEWGFQEMHYKGYFNRS